MKAANGILFALLGLSIVQDIFPWQGYAGVRLVVLGVGLLLAANGVPAGEQAHLKQVLQFALAILLIPALWVVIQLLPLGITANPIWESVSAALGTHVSAGATIDVGETALCLVELMFFVGSIVLTTTLAIDRRRAERILLATSGTCLLLACAGPISALLLHAEGISRASTRDAAALTVLLATACANIFLEKFENRSAAGGQDIARTVAAECVCVFSFVLSFSLLLESRDWALLSATLCALGTFIGLVIIRRSDLGMLGISLVLLTLIAFAGGLAFSGTSKGLPFTIEYSSAPNFAIDQTRRMLADAPLMGTGAGSINAVSNVYRTYDDPTPFVPASGAALAMIEMGGPMFLVIIGLVAVGFFLLARASIKRGRDSAYAINGASVLVLLLFASFSNSGLFAPVLTISISSTIGLALAQSESRRVV